MCLRSHRTWHIQQIRIFHLCLVIIIIFQCQRALISFSFLHWTVSKQWILKSCVRSLFTFWSFRKTRIVGKNFLRLHGSVQKIFCFLLHIVTDCYLRPVRNELVDNIFIPFLLEPTKWANNAYRKSTVAKTFDNIICKFCRPRKNTELCLVSWKNGLILTDRNIARVLSRERQWLARFLRHRLISILLPAARRY